MPRSFSLLIIAALLVGQPSWAAPVAAPFQKQWLTPYHKTGKPGRARRWLVAGQPDKAIPLLRAYLSQGNARDQAQATFILGQALLRTGKFKEAEQIFSLLHGSYPLLRDYHLLYGARALMGMKKYKAAAKRAAMIGTGSTADRPVLYRPALLLQAQALFAAGEHISCVPLFEGYLAGSKPSAHMGPQLQLAQALVAVAKQLGPKGGGSNPQPEAITALKHVVIWGQLTAHAKPAAELMARLAAKIPGGEKLTVLTPWERFQQAMVLDRAMRNKRAEAAFKELLKEKLSDDLACKVNYHLARSVFKQRDRARAEPFYTKAIEACSKAKNTDLEVKSLYNGARCLYKQGKHGLAVARFAELEQKHPGHSYADDARLRAAEVLADQDKEEEAAKLLADIPGRYPTGDMKRDALWRLARGAYFAGKLDEATRLLDRILKELGRADIYYAHGRALYWKARILARQKQKKKARALWERCIREYPLSYYALLSFNQLRRLAPRQYRALTRELLRPHPTGRTVDTWHFPPQRLFARPGFLRGVELCRLGFGGAAARELASEGLQIARDQDTTNLWLAAVLHDSAGLWHVSHQVPRAMDTGHRWTHPVGENRRRWLMSYPLAFPDLVRENAAAEGVSPWLVLAVMREESGFSTTIESYANAVGLMQMIMPTARTAARQHKLDVSRELLHDPAVNIKLGATYLGFLTRAFKDTSPLTISGYNAGEGAAHRWLKRWPKLSVDELIELIPYDQTRGYTKRVLSSLFTYSVLYGDSKERVPVIPFKLPRVARKELSAAWKTTKQKTRNKKQEAKSKKQKAKSKKPLRR